jgi:predicted TIM-barrel fold metal-dependent hydrolase
MYQFKLIDADSHTVEPNAAYVRVQREYGDRAPHLVQDPPELGKGVWLITDGLEPVRSAFFALGHVVEKPGGHEHMDIMDDPVGFRRRIQTFNESYRYEDYPGGWEPTARLKDMDRDGVEAAIIFSSPTRFNYAQEDAKFQRAIFRSFNDWLIDEFCAAAPNRLFGMPLISILDIDLAVADMREYVKRGCKSVHIPTQILGSGYYEGVYEPLWATAQELGIPLTVHSNSTQNLKRHHQDQHPRGYDARQYTIKAGRAQPVLDFVSNLIFSGVFDRYPGLQVVCQEFDVGWIPAVLQQVDYTFGRESTYDPEKNLIKRKPSEYFWSNVFFSFEDDRTGMLTTPVYGEDNYMWGSDYPHHTSTWPFSHRILAANVAETQDPERLAWKVGRENTNRAYKLGLATEAPAEAALVGAH